jgi:hypothetical protein
MHSKKSFSILAAVLALGVAGPTVALAHDGNDGNDGNKDATTAPVTAPVTAPASTSTPADAQGGQNQSTADEQQSGEQGDTENTDLATQVEAVDGADQADGVTDENEVGDGADGQLDNGTQGDGGSQGGD